MLVVSYCKHLFFVIPLIITQRKPLIICWQTDRQMNIINPEFYFCQSVPTALDNLCVPGYANAYFYALFIFAMRFYQFSMRNYAFTRLICSSVQPCGHVSIYLSSGKVNQVPGFCPNSSVGRAYRLWFWRLIWGLLVQSHCLPLFFFQNESCLCGYVLTAEDPQSEWLKHEESNRVYWFETRISSLDSL